MINFNGNQQPQHNEATAVETNSTNNTNIVTTPYRYALSFTVITTTISSLFIVYGFYLRSTFHNGSECDMTWSVPGYRPLQFPNTTTTSTSATNSASSFSSSSSHAQYRLLKFIDRRDPEYNKYGEILQHSHTLKHHHDNIIGKQESDNTATATATANTNNNNNNNNKPIFSEWCPKKQSSDHAILYIPGHQGYYSQARSIGAHGTRLTRKAMSTHYSTDIYNAVANGTLSSQSSTSDKFVYTVFTIDFQEEGAGFHASLLYSQAEFITKCVEMLYDECGVIRHDGDDMDFPMIRDMTIVAHSTGGIVARKALTLLADKGLVGKRGGGDTTSTSSTTTTTTTTATSGFVKHLITLASPHVYFPFVLDNTVHQFYKTLLQEEERIANHHGGNPIPVVSISGGLRDELIPPSSCELINDGGSKKSRNDDDSFQYFSIFATDIMRNREEITMNGIPPTFGMDHKAITWCHNLLSVVQELIHMMVTLDSSSSSSSTSTSSSSSLTVNEMNERIQDFLDTKTRDGYSQVDGTGTTATNNNEHYNVMLGEQKLQNDYGYWSSQAIQATQLYNTQLFTLLYALTGLLHQLLNYTMQTQSKENISSVYAFGFVPIITSMLVYLCIGQNSIFYQKNIIVVLALACLARNLYFLILGLAIPLSHVRKRLAQSFAHPRGALDHKKKLMGKSPTSLMITIMTKMIHGQIYWFLIVFFSYIGVLSLLNFLGLFGDYKWAMNMTSIMSHCFIVLTILLLGNILDIGTRYDSTTDRRQGSLQWVVKECQIHRTTAALLLPTFLVIMTGKVVYAWILVSVDGQEKSRPFERFQEGLWGSTCLDQNSLISFCRAGALMKYDLAMTTTFVSIPLLIIILYVRYRYVSRYLSHHIGSSKQL